jgi:ribosomal protein L2
MTNPLLFKIDKLTKIDDFLSVSEFFNIYKVLENEGIEWDINRQMSITLQYNGGKKLELDSYYEEHQGKRVIIDIDGIAYDENAAAFIVRIKFDDGKEDNVICQNNPSFITLVTKDNVPPVYCIQMTTGTHKFYEIKKSIKGVIGKVMPTPRFIKTK